MGREIARTRLPVFTHQPQEGDRLPTAWLWIALLAALCFILDLVVVESGGLAADDRRLDLWVHQHLGPASYAFFRAVTTAGSSAPRIIAIAGLVGILLLIRRFWSAVLLVMGGGVGDLVESVVNHIIARPRPHLFPHAVAATGYSFPSGHSTGIAALCLVLAYLAWHLTRQRDIAAVAGILAASLAGLVGLSRVVLGVHYPTDVLGGFLFSTAWVGGVIYLLAPALHRERLARLNR